MNLEQCYQRLAHAGLLQEKRGHWQTTPTWERALMRAEAKVIEFNETIGEPRVAITYALLDALGPDIAEEDLRDMVELLLPLEIAEEQEMEPETEAAASEDAQLAR
ncbi:MAG TPA: hypothetical protein VGR28_10605 [Candidatus Thermoplasmatota archaeon]|jgi:hypothetical protein|nr:hypothetical protein [Candidatus Thermoplasmatota archaeon]